jgi:hypothetical protein
MFGISVTACHRDIPDLDFKQEMRDFVQAASHRELDNIPSYPSAPFSENTAEITSLNEIKNFLYLINPELFHSKHDFINAIVSTNYDLLIMDLFFDEEAFTASEVEALNGRRSSLAMKIHISTRSLRQNLMEPTWILLMRLSILRNYRAWGVGHGAWGMGHGAWGVGYGVWSGKSYPMMITFIPSV